MQLRMEYARITNQFFTAFHQHFKCFNHECQMPIAHSVFKQTVLIVSTPPVLATHDQSLLQNDTIALSVNSWSWSFCIVDKTVFSRPYVGQLWHVSLIVSQHSTSHMIIYWHIHMVHFLLFLHQNCSLVTGSLTKLYF